MKKKVIFILIQIFVVALALALTVTTYAWFVSQTRVVATETTVTAAAGANTTIENEEDFTYEPYMGQTGLGNPFDETRVDCPYVVKKKLTVKFRPLSEDSYLTAKIKLMEVRRTTGETASSETEGNAHILDYFTWRIQINARTIGENVETYPDTSAYEYGPDGNGFLSRIDGEGNLMRYVVDQEMTVELTFELVFLDERSYRNYLNGDYGADSITEFAYCGYENMRAVFTCAFEIGLDVISETSGGEGE